MSGGHQIFPRVPALAPILMMGCRFHTADSTSTSIETIIRLIIFSSFPLGLPCSVFCTVPAWRTRTLERYTTRVPIARVVFRNYHKINKSSVYTRRRRVFRRKSVQFTFVSKPDDDDAWKCWLIRVLAEILGLHPLLCPRGTLHDCKELC